LKNQKPPVPQKPKASIFENRTVSAGYGKNNLSSPICNFKRLYPKIYVLLAVERRVSERRTAKGSRAKSFRKAYVTAGKIYHL
jgi:hypothetical protein